MKVLSAKEVYNELLSQGIKTSTGKILFSFLSTKVTISAKSPYGYVFQDWLAQWFKDNDIFYEQPTNSQEFPDFYLKPDDKKNGLLEIKTFDYEASPNFDVANFEAYINSVKIHPNRLDADYLIFAYSVKDEQFCIDDVWLKKIWEICCSSERYPIKCQIKRDMIYNIRPAVWYSGTASYKPFKTKAEFINALYKTLLSYKKTKSSAKEWYERMLEDINSIETLQ